jgi:hypothetical protein
MEAVKIRILESPTVEPSTVEIPTFEPKTLEPH